MCVSARVCVSTCVYTCTLAFIARACASSPPVRRRFTFLNERRYGWWGYRNGLGSLVAKRRVRRGPFFGSVGNCVVRSARGQPAHGSSLFLLFSPSQPRSFVSFHSRLNFVIAYTRVSALRVFFSRLLPLLLCTFAPSLGPCRRRRSRCVRLFLLFCTFSLLSTPLLTSPLLSAPLLCSPFVFSFCVPFKIFRTVRTRLLR